MFDFRNPSWPQGEWRVEYIQHLDCYRIMTERNQFVADVGPTLAAYWIVEIYNALYNVTKKLS